MIAHRARKPTGLNQQITAASHTPFEPVSTPEYPSQRLSKPRRTARTPPESEVGQRADQFVLNQPRMVNHLLEFTSGGASVSFRKVRFAPNINRIKYEVQVLCGLCHLIPDASRKRLNSPIRFAAVDRNACSDRRQQVKPHNGVLRESFSKIIGQMCSPRRITP
jgi:hypothetical protein